VKWAREHVPPTRPTGGRGRGSRSARWRAASRVGVEWNVEWKTGVCVFNCERVQEVMQAKQGMCSERDERSNVFAKGIEGMCRERDKGRDVFPF